MNKEKKEEIKEKNENENNNNNKADIKELEKVELSNQKIKDEDIQKDKIDSNLDKDVDNVTQAKDMQKELNKNETINITEDKKDEKNVDNNRLANKEENIVINNTNIIEDKKDEKNIDSNETENKKENIDIKNTNEDDENKIDLLKKENMELIKEINILKENDKLLNQELDDYEKEAKESEIEVNMLRENNKKLLEELEQYKNQFNEYSKGEKNLGPNSMLNTIKENNDYSNNNDIFAKIYRSFADKILFKKKVKLYINMIVAQKIEQLLIENNKLNNDKISLIERVNILTELLNHPEDIGKYVDEEGNLNMPEYENYEDINLDNKNINIEKEGENNDQIIEDDNNNVEDKKDKENNDQLTKEDNNDEEDKNDNK